MGSNRKGSFNDTRLSIFDKILVEVVAALLAGHAAAHVPAHCKGEGCTTLADGLEKMMILHAEIEAGANASTIALMVFTTRRKPATARQRPEPRGNDTRLAALKPQTATDTYRRALQATTASNRTS